MILVFGKSGQVARALDQTADVTCLGRDDCNLLTSGAATAAIAEHNPKAVINAAAFTDVDGAEAAPGAAFRLNAHAVGEMGWACAAQDIPLVHISTDYVFDGSGDEPWDRNAVPAPLNTYGRSKAAGEAALRDSSVTHVILRTSWVYSTIPHNFLTKMLDLGAKRDNLNIVADQTGGPTPADAIAQAALTIAHRLRTQPQVAGTYHFAGAPNVSWAGFARAIFQAAALPCQVAGIPSAAYPTPARRPLNSRMSCSETMSVFGIPRPDWQQNLGEIVGKNA